MSGILETQIEALPVKDKISRSRAEKENIYEEKNTAVATGLYCNR